jgi:hypothetical protein
MSARRAAVRATGRPSRAWARMSRERLLAVRLRNLGLSIEGTWLQECVDQLYAQLERRRIRLRPHVWLSDEWFSPAGVPGIAIPFYLAHPRLLRLERSMMLDVEGGTHKGCMRILRHETGHAIQHAYRLHRRRRWQELFGKSTIQYPDYYRPNPASKRYVQHLGLWYAQSHPDEDFAETFAVWLGRRSAWRRRYLGWPALRKLEYVDSLMQEIGDTTPPVRTRRTVDPISQIRKTLGDHYDKRRAQYSVAHPDIWDADLRRVFSDDPRDRQREAASTFLRRNRGELRRMVSRWTGEHQFVLDLVLENMIGRCRELRLRVSGSDRSLRTNFAVLLTAKTMHFLYDQGRRDWIAL